MSPIIKRRLSFIITQYLPDFIFLKKTIFDEFSKNKIFETEGFFPSSRDHEWFHFFNKQAFIEINYYLTSKVTTENCRERIHFNDQLETGRF